MFRDRPDYAELPVKVLAYEAFNESGKRMMHSLVEHHV